MSEHVKSYSPEIEKANIYFLEKCDKFVRLAVQIDEEQILEKLIRDFIYELSEIEILVKTTDFNIEQQGGDPWKRYFGEISKEKLLSGIKKYQYFIFHDGFIQFLIKNSITDEYICLDEYGILYYYLNSFEKIEKELKSLNIEEVFDNKFFVSSHFCYKLEIKNHDNYVNEFIKEYHLEYGEKL
jgi:hypothetical protein